MEELDYRYNYVIFGCAGVVRAWVNRNCQESPEELAELTIQMIQGARMVKDMNRR